MPPTSTARVPAKSSSTAARTMCIVLARAHSLRRVRRRRSDPTRAFPLRAGGVWLATAPVRADGRRAAPRDMPARRGGPRARLLRGVLGPGSLGVGGGEAVARREHDVQEPEHHEEHRRGVPGPRGPAELRAEHPPPQAHDPEGHGGACGENRDGIAEVACGHHEGATRVGGGEMRVLCVPGGVAAVGGPVEGADGPRQAQAEEDVHRV
mmetsp:Transcript_3992/g.13372  ORF Transcript_3992/g.13372 Transcript_3992/m.13372 type:complete len:209 (-) Transcript_3992:227-853(-)